MTYHSVGWGGGGGVNTKERQLLYQNEAAMLS